MEKRDRATHDLFGLSRRCRRLRLRLRVRREEAVFIEHHKSREWRRNERTNGLTDWRLAGAAWLVARTAHAHFTHWSKDALHSVGIPPRISELNSRNSFAAICPSL